MKFGHLKDFFAAYAWKRLTPVEVDRTKSNQSEFNVTDQLRDVLGTTTRRCKEGNGIPARCIFVGDEEEEWSEGNACFSYYESRAKKRAIRGPEWRLYYTKNPVFGAGGRATPGDTLFLGFGANLESITAIAARKGSTAESQLKWLFGIADNENSELAGSAVSPNVELNAAATRILETLGFEVSPKDDSLLDKMLRRFKGVFPRSDVFSEFVRKQSPDVRDTQNVDEALVTWMEKEEFAFRVLEKHILKERLATGFSDVDEFVQLSLSVQNRRKARAGRAFENHLKEIFLHRFLVFDQGPRLGDLTRPDFLFPGAAQYSDEHFPLGLLTLLGAKTTCKDRWRQVLAEGKRMDERYLVTLEPAISVNQLSEMRAASLQLVVPKALHATYAESERAAIRSVEDFVTIATKRQKKSGIRPSAAVAK